MRHAYLRFTYHHLSFELFRHELHNLICISVPSPYPGSLIVSTLHMSALTLLLQGLLQTLKISGNLSDRSA